MKRFIVILCLFLLTCGCSKKEEIMDIEDNIDTKDSIIIDVRTKEEYDELHVKNSINIPYNEIDEDINLDKSKTIYVYCRSGNRSSIAYDILDNLGYDVVDLHGIDSIDLPKEK